MKKKAALQVRNVAQSPITKRATPPAAWLPPHADLLTQVLEGLRLRCMAPSAHEMTAPWGVRFGPVSSDQIRKHAAAIGLPIPPGKPPMPSGAIVAIIRGSCWLEVEQHQLTLPLTGGDLVIINRKVQYVLRDNLHSAIKPLHELLRREHIEQRRGLQYGGGGIRTTYLSGAFSFEDEEDNPLLQALPPVIHIRATESINGPWIDGTLKFLAHELALRLPGSQSIINHLTHVLFVQAVRAYATSLPKDETGNWFNVLQDSEIAPAMNLIHIRPETPWTIAALAEQCNMSRSAFAAKFTETIGHPPLQYLTEYRIRIARSLLRETKLGIKMIATKVGYTNESAFGNAFRRTTGMSPGRYRQSKS